MNKETVYLEKIIPDNLSDLAYALNTDIVLRRDLGIKETDISIESLYEKTMDWMLKTNSITYCIRVGKKSIGMISISHIDKSNMSARCGYWLLSEYRGRGYTTEAFSQIVEIATGMKLKELHSSINMGNKASLAIWKRYLPKLIDKVDHYDLTISLK